MKKFSVPFMLLQVAVLLVISFVVALVINICNGGEDLVSASINIGMVFFFLIGICYLVMGNLFTQRLAERTMEKKSKEQNFRECSTFYSSGVVIRIDESTGRIACVASQNPFEFQVISAKDISDIRTYCIKGPLGGTRYVSFEFVYQGKKMRIPTFTSRQTYSMESSEVLTAISKADTYCEILQNAKNVVAGEEV